MANRPRVLVANPDPGICRLLQRYFGNVGYSVITTDRGHTVLEQLRHAAADVIILSTDLSDIGSVDLISGAHAIANTPLLVLMPPKAVMTPGEVLDAGADDCLTEPFLLEELGARIRRLLHRAGVWLGPRVLMTARGHLEINPLERSVSLGGAPLVLSRKEFDLLVVLAAANGSMLSHETILYQVWGDVDEGARQNLRRMIGSLRRKIEPKPKQPSSLVSIRGSGYRLDVQLKPKSELEQV